MKRALTFLTLLLALPAATLQAQETTIIIVRHAERAAEPANDPVLTEAGTARANSLLESVRHAGITQAIDNASRASNIVGTAECAAGYTITCAADAAEKPQTSIASGVAFITRIISPARAMR